MMETYSHSKLSTFEQCRLKYKYKYIDKIKTSISNTIEAFMGDLVHRSLEKIYKDLQFTKLLTKEEVIKYYEKLWAEEYDDSILIVKEYSSENYKEKGKNMIKSYYDTYHPFNQGKTIGLETQDYFDLNENYRVHVRIDRLTYVGEGVYEIHDYKTNNSLKTQPQADKDRQLAIYNMGVKKLYPDAKEIVLVWHFLEFDKEIRSKRSQKDLDNLKKEVINLIETTKQEREFEPTKSKLCDYCEYKEICPAWKHLYELKDKDITDDFGVKLVDKYAKLKEIEKRLNIKLEKVGNKLEDFAQKKDLKVIYGSDQAVTIWSKNVFKAPKKDDPLRKEFENTMKNLNLYEVYSDIDTWNLEKDFEKLSEIQKKVLRNFMTRQKISRVYIRRR